MKHFLGILALIAGLLLGLPAGAEDLVTARAVLEDAAGTLTIADVAGREFQPAGPTLSRGYTDSAHWLRLRVRAPARGGEVVLRIRPSFLNEVRIYEADDGAPAGWKTRVTGNRHAYDARDRTDIALNFVVPVTTAEATFYLRLKTDTVSQLSVEALEPGEADRRSAQLDLLLVFFVTSLVYLTLWAVQAYVLDRQAVVGLFALHQVIYILSGLALAGYLAPFAPARFPHMVDMATSILTCAMNFTGLLFSHALFKPYEPPRPLMRGLTLFLLAFPLQVLAIALGHTGFALGANAVLVMVLSWYFVLLAFTARRELVPSRRVLRAIFVAITCLAMLFWFSSFGWVTIAEGNLKDMVVVVANGLIASGLLALLLHARLRQLRQEAQQSAQDLALARKTLDIERALKEEAELRARTDYLTGLFNRRHFIELAEHELARAVRYERPLSLLMVDIDLFKSINDTWGHALGDAVLQEVSHLIRHCLRDVDIVGRIGGEEFAAVLVETDEQHALGVAERLCATVADTTIAPQEGVSLRVTISLGITELKGRALGFDSLLKEADLALYEAKQSGRNRAVSSG